LTKGFARGWGGGSGKRLGGEGRHYEKGGDFKKRSNCCGTGVQVRVANTSTKEELETDTKQKIRGEGRRDEKEERGRGKRSKRKHGKQTEKGRKTHTSGRGRGIRREEGKEEGNCTKNNLRPPLNLLSTLDGQRAGRSILGDHPSKNNKARDIREEGEWARKTS